MNHKPAFMTAALLVLAGCSNISTRIDYDKEADFGSYKTFAWKATPETSAKDKSDRMHRHIVTAIQSKLQEGGLLLVESGFNRLVDEVVVVDCPEHEQRRRLMSRDGADATQAERMMAAQIGRDARLAAADAVIDNGDELDATRAQVQVLHRRYLDMARRARTD